MTEEAFCAILAKRIKFEKFIKHATVQDFKRILSSL